MWSGLMIVRSLRPRLRLLKLHRSSPKGTTGNSSGREPRVPARVPETEPQRGDTSLNVRMCRPSGACFHNVAMNPRADARGKYLPPLRGYQSVQLQKPEPGTRSLVLIRTTFAAGRCGFLVTVVLPEQCWQPARSPRRASTIQRLGDSALCCRLLRAGGSWQSCCTPHDRL